MIEFQIVFPIKLKKLKKGREKDLLNHSVVNEPLWFY